MVSTHVPAGRKVTTGILSIKYTKQGIIVSTDITLTPTYLCPNFTANAPAKLHPGSQTYPEYDKYCFIDYNICL